MCDLHIYFTLSHKKAQGTSLHKALGIISEASTSLPDKP